MSLAPSNRRLLFPLVIIVVAAGITLWSQHQQNQVTRQASDFVEAIVDGQVAPPASAPPGFNDALRALRDEMTRRDLSAQVQVSEGDTGPGADGRATHTGMVVLEGQARMGLRLMASDPGGGVRVDIVGFWDPTSFAAENPAP